MFLGQFEHALDAKGRVVLPAEYREDFEGGAVLAKLHDGCLGLWTKEEFTRVATELVEKAKRGAKERNVARMIGASAKQLTPDRAGRVVIPPLLRDYARLDRDLVIVGAINRMEIWDATKWREVDEASSGDLLTPADDLSDVAL